MRVLILGFTTRVLEYISCGSVFCFFYASYLISVILIVNGLSSFCSTLSWGLSSGFFFPIKPGSTEIIDSAAFYIAGYYGAGPGP